MKQFYRLKLRLRLELGILTLSLAALGLVHLPAFAAEGSGQKPVSRQNEKAPTKNNAAKSQKTATGAELYAVHCNRCHPERYAPERTAEQWKTILVHMRTRVNLPAAQARAILQYLQEDSGK